MVLDIRQRRTGNPRQDIQDRTVRTGHPGQDIQDRKSRTGQPGQGRTVETGQNSYSKTAGTGELDRSDCQVSLDRSA